MRTYRKPARHKRNPVGLYGSDKPLPERPSVLVSKRGEVALSSEADVAALMPAAVARVRWGSCHWRKRWHAVAKHFGLGWQLVVKEEDSYLSGGATSPALDRNITVVIEVWGAGEALAAALGSECVASWEYRVLAVSPDRATEVGPVSRAQTGKPKPKSPNDHAFASQDRVLARYKAKPYKLPESDGPDGFVRQ